MGGSPAVGAAKRQAGGIEVVPHGRIGIGGFQRIVIETGDALHVGQRWHVHDRHAGHARFRHRVEQFAHAGRAVLRLLHGKADQVEVLRVDAGGAAGGDLAGQLLRVEHDWVATAAHRQADAEAFGVDQIGLGRQAHVMNLVPAKKHFGGQQRAVGRAHHQDFISLRLARRRFRHLLELAPPLRQRRHHRIDLGRVRRRIPDFGLRLRHVVDLVPDHHAKPVVVTAYARPNFASSPNTSKCITPAAALAAPEAAAETPSRSGPLP